jgi:hypothetical protein
MATEGGIGLRDGQSDNRILDGRNSQVRWGILNAFRYGVTNDTIWQPDSYVGEESFWKLLDQAGVEVRLETNFVEGPSGIIVERNTRASSPHIHSLRIEGNSNEVLKAKFFIDASYEGELMQAAGVSFTFGRESSDTYNESWAGITNHSAAQFPLPINPFQTNTTTLLRYIQKAPDPRRHIGESDDNVMSYSYRVCLTTDPANKVPLTPPAGYDPNDFELARRLIQAQVVRNLTISEPWCYLEYNGYKQITKSNMKYDACCGFSPFGIDNPGLAVGYANASRAERARIADNIRYFVQGLMWFWQTDPIIPERIRQKHASYGLCKDEWADNGHFPRQLYAREALRLVGDRIFIQKDRSKECLQDSIAVASWFFDIHDVQRVAVQIENNGTWTVWNEGLVGYQEDKSYPFDLPYWILLPKKAEVANLAVTNCPSVSHVAFSALREEPTLWALGHAAGLAAAMASSQGLASFHDVNVNILREALRSQGGRIHFPADCECE